MGPNHRKKQVCEYCKRLRGNLGNPDWKAHLARCEQQANQSRKTPSVRGFLVPLAVAATVSQPTACGGGDGDGGTKRRRTLSPSPPALGSSDGDGGSVNTDCDADVECSSSVFDETEVAGEDDLVFLDVQLHEDDVVPVVSPPPPSPSSSSLGISDSFGSHAPTLRSPLSSPSSPLSAQEQVNDDCPPGSAAAGDPDIQVPVPDGSASVLEEENKSLLDPTDPATFCRLLTFSENVVGKILTVGVDQPNASDEKGGCFPSTSNNRKFNPDWYFRKLLDGTLQRRTWLSHSETTDRVYCIDCILFGKSSQKNCHPTFTRNGFQHWKRGNGALIEHETSEAHVEASIKHGLRQLSLPLDASAKQERLSKWYQNREIVRQLPDVILHLAQHCLAFRGHRESRSESFRGNFHDLVTLLAKYSPVLATYLDKLNSSEKKVWNFVSWKRQNQLIQAISEFIQKKIVSEIGEALFFSVSFDESVDSSRTEQCICIIRYVRTDTGTVPERLVAVRDSATTTGEKLFEVIQDIFKELGLDWTTYLVGQSYDGA
ncbi:Zinc finger MYM-type protein 1 [Frankliniella fusca]|uniref:Zinc finger MYM-type protein 1 n=1 Tax=Frankliniella fusca TaxID=407009 RepID=A0AAE1GV98_9NEOP|nr:Zinc finger MYM-type protein 1 [Frankliniella fusca]